jgi:hypothetical protein
MTTPLGDPPLPSSRITQTPAMTVMETLSRRFLRFAELECNSYAPFYDRLARGIACDPDLLGIAAYTRSGQQEPNLFLAAVHYLLLRGADHPLAVFYPSVTQSAAVPAGDPVPAFRSFCHDYRAALIELVSSRLVQTNVPGRCAVLLPAFMTVTRLAGGIPLALVEVGASAGLNLLFDRYSYDYGAGRFAGDPKSPVQFQCVWRSTAGPPAPREMPQVATRVGIDLNPIHASDPESLLWLQFVPRSSLVPREAWLFACSIPPPWATSLSRLASASAPWSRS